MGLLSQLGLLHENRDGVLIKRNISIVRIFISFLLRRVLNLMQILLFMVVSKIYRFRTYLFVFHPFANMIATYRYYDVLLV